MDAFSILLIIISPIIVMVGLCLLMMAVFQQLEARSEKSESKPNFKKTYCWALGLIGFATVGMVALYKGFYIAAGAAV